MRKLSNIVTHQTPLTLTPATTVQEACAQMRDRRAGSVLITDENSSLVGIFTATDAVCRVLAARLDPAVATLAEVMTPDPVTISPEKPAIDALRLMWDGGFHHVPLTRSGEVIGVVARSDFTGDEHERLASERQLWEHMR
jgi:CBS domain-containing protein